MAGLTLGTGALIAVEKNDRTAYTFLKNALESGRQITIPAVVLAQAWRGPRSNRFSWIIQGSWIETMDKTLAYRVGELCARSRTSDVVDAIVVWGAAQRNDDVLTSDPGDILLLAGHVDGLGHVIKV